VFSFQSVGWFPVSTLHVHHTLFFFKSKVVVFVENIRKTKAYCTKYLGFALKILSKTTIFEKIHKFYNFQKFLQN